MYRVLYRKWRPQVFSDVIGQPQVTLTLSSQIKENRLSHAYLFTGSRGTGKTTCAKIFSKAINCLNPIDGNPCNECEICRGIDNGTVLDIVEIDAASNRGIDDIRILRDETNFTPSQAKYRVYIIDEVHMLTIEAFNALLKTLEEPPAYVKFILATTEVQKLPATILSRCQRFDFRRIEPETIAGRIVEIAKAENASLDFDAAMLIARIADGAMRDSLSLLDRCLGVTNNVTADVVSSAAGLMGREYLNKLISAIADRDTAESLRILDELHKASCDTERLCTELINQFRNFLILKTVERPENLIVCTSQELEEIKSVAARFTAEQILSSLSILSNASEAIRRTQNRRIEAEMALIRLCRPETSTDTDALLARISVLENQIKELTNGTLTINAALAAPALHENKPAPEEKISALRTPAPDMQKPADIPGTAPVSTFSPDGKAVRGKFAPPEIPEDADDEPFDFDAFMAENSGNTNANESTDSSAPTVSDDDFPFNPDEFEAPPEDTFGNDGFASANEELPFANASSPNETGTDNQEYIPERTWLKIVLEAEKAFKPIIGLLTDSKAYINGNAIMIKLANPKVKLFINEGIINTYVGRSAEGILKKSYVIRIDN